VEKIKRLHLLLAFYNAMQRCVAFGLDLVGASPCRRAVREQLADGDTRWINRGAMTCWARTGSDALGAGLPRAGLCTARCRSSSRSPTRSPRNWRLLRCARSAFVRGTFATYRACSQRLLSGARAAGESGLEITAINFGSSGQRGRAIRAAPGAKAIDVLDPQAPMSESGRRQLRLH